ncbi:hypothetical protein ACTXT7_017522, partial [Hymenolepis weldensis]
MKRDRPPLKEAFNFEGHNLSISSSVCPKYLCPKILFDAGDWDSHLFALRQVAKSNDKQLASMFTKDDYERISSVDLRTSPLQSDCASANLLKGVPIGARLPSFHGGYAIVYGIN